MRNYKTQMDAARRGIITPEMKAVAAEDSCSMCGKFCAVRSMNKALAGEYIDIL